MEFTPRELAVLRASWEAMIEAIDLIKTKPNRSLRVNAFLSRMEGEAYRLHVLSEGESIDDD
jgi:hypothetical protein